MIKKRPARTPGHNRWPVVWAVGLFLVLLFIGTWILYTMLRGLSPHDPKPHSPETRSAVKAAEQTAHALAQADADGTLSEPEARSAVADGGVLTQLSLEDDSGSLTVAFPYTEEPPGTGITLRRYVCVYFLVLTGQAVETNYSGGCPVHPRPLTTTTGVGGFAR
ncbi:hypothetical protein OG552_30090 [Streptomyces sp. NBC_01476]|uniref:hypothetical protein n=1 Tax=Streptomyces sp. NBC_01476 TaxID=2903881 RepID=UPI002E30EDA0|nr:hypothetical protein [Streptomyces sp. NBC_01476]